jgi:DNA-directed RNA polymerase subunit RPC12/RpoP
MLQKTLKIVPPPLILAAVPNAPPVLEQGPEPTVEYNCGNCGAALMRVDQSKVHALMVHCTSCDTYNSTAG